MNVIADLQLHSKYSRAVSQQMVLPEIARWAKRKGIELIATGDWTHPLWLREIKAHLEEDGSGLLKIKNQKSNSKNEVENFDEVRVGKDPLFLLATEISSIYSQGGKLRRIHNLIWVPSIATADKVIAQLQKRGANLLSDGRPIVGLTSRDIAELVLTIDPASLIIPAHAWTPWFSLFGSESGFDSIEECFGPFAKYIYAIETGLSSDPAMNWRIKELDTRAILSFSDAHSGAKLGREATVFKIKDQPFDPFDKLRASYTQDKKSKSISYDEIAKAIKQDPSGEWQIAYTIEFYPEEGKYHYTGHRNCGIKQTPADTAKKGVICPVCGRKLTVGVMHRVEELAGRSEEELELTTTIKIGQSTHGIASKAFPNRPPYVMLVPLQEILAECLGALVGSQKVQSEYTKLVEHFDGEFRVLLGTPLENITAISGPKVALGIGNVRSGNIVIDPGFDGVFGHVKIWGEEKTVEKAEEKEQMSLF